MRKALIVFAAGLVLTPLFLFLYWDHNDDSFGITDTDVGWWEVFGLLAIFTFLVTVVVGFVLALWHVSEYIDDRRLRRERKQLESGTSRETR